MAPSEVHKEGSSCLEVETSPRVSGDGPEIVPGTVLGNEVPSGAPISHTLFVGPSVQLDRES